MRKVAEWIALVVFAVSIPAAGILHSWLLAVAWVTIVVLTVRPAWMSLMFAELDRTLKRLEEMQIQNVKDFAAIDRDQETLRDRLRTLRLVRKPSVAH